MELARSAVWNLHEVMHGINPKENARWRVMPYAYGDMMHLLRKYDVTPLRSAMMRCLPNVPSGTHHSLQRSSLGVAIIICRRQTSFKKRTFVLADKSAFFVGWG